MKKLLLIAAFAVFALTANAQDGGGDATGEGTWLVEINTGFGESSTANTGFALRSIDGNTAWAAGGEAGYFILDDLALKAGLGYSDSGVDGVDGTFNWKFGGKYYIAGQFPVAADVNGASGNDVSPLWVGIQAGYAWFVADNVSIEPGLRYGLGMNEDAGDGDFNVFGVNIGFNVFFN
ncbi:MAG: hypothetical protein AAFP76_11705 [Bacteroidota bacterium]